MGVPPPVTAAHSCRVRLYAVTECGSSVRPCWSFGGVVTAVLAGARSLGFFEWVGREVAREDLAELCCTIHVFEGGRAPEDMTTRRPCVHRIRQRSLHLLHNPLSLRLAGTNVRLTLGARRSIVKGRSLWDRDSARTRRR